VISLPKNTPLGFLEIKDIFEYFDFPRLFTCKNKSNSIFLAVSTYDDSETFEWLYLPTSPDRIKSLIDQKISLNEAFTNPEDGYLLKVISDFLGNSKFEYLFPEQVPLTDLPSAGAMLSSTETSHYGLGEIDAKASAESSHRETYNLHLYPHNTKLPEISSKKLGNILIISQELIDALGQVTAGQPTIKGAIAADILEQTRLNACQIFEGSFGIQLKSEKNSDLFKKSLLSESLQEFINLLLTEDIEDNISNKLHELKGRVASKYRALLKEIYQLKSPLKIEWGSPNKDLGGNVYLSSEKIERAYKIVSRVEIEMSEEIEIDSELLGLDTATKRYRLTSLLDKTEYSGKVTDEALQNVMHSEINAHYRATIKKVIETNSTSGYEINKWILVGLTRLKSIK
jgi:hypothetical protein